MARYGGGRLIPRPDDAAFADHLYWFHLANSSMQPSAMVDLVLRVVGVERSDVAPLLTRRPGLACVTARLSSICSPGRLPATLAHLHEDERSVRKDHRPLGEQEPLADDLDLHPGFPHRTSAPQT